MTFTRPPPQSPPPIGLPPPPKQAGLFRAVADRLQSSVAAAVVAAAERAGPDPGEQLRAGSHAFLDEITAGLAVRILLDAMTAQLSGAMNEAALWIAQHEDGGAARDQAQSALDRLLAAALLRLRRGPIAKPANAALPTV